MSFWDMFRRKPPVRDKAALADFIDSNAAFLVQKGIFEYSSARAGHYSKVLFAEPQFKESIALARWQAFPLGLAMVGELAEGLLRPHVGGERRAALDSLTELVLSVFDRYPVPEAIGRDEWAKARARLAHELDLVGTHAPKHAKDVPERFAEEYFDLMPIHQSLRGRDAGTMRNYLRVTACNIHDELLQRLDAPAVARTMLPDGAAAPH